MTPLGAPSVACICCCETHSLLLPLQIYGWVMLHGLVLRLDPSKYTMKLKRSSEAVGNTSAFPAFAWANIAIVVCATIFYGVLMIPGCNVIHQSTGYIVLGSQIFMVWFANWVSSSCLLLPASLACLQSQHTSSQMQPPVSSKDFLFAPKHST